MNLIELTEEAEKRRGEAIAYGLVLRALMWTRPDARDVLAEHAKDMRAGPLYADLTGTSRQALEATLEALIDEP